MAAVDMAVFEQPIASDTAFDLHQALAFMHRMSLEDRSEFIVGLTLNQATDVLSEMPFREVNELLEQLEESGHEGRARQISMVLGLISSEAEPAGDYLDNSVLSHVRERVGWIVGLALMGIVSGLIISKYEDAISTLVLLAIYMPVVAAAGGNTGSQAATLVVRALATNDITLADWAKVLWKEFRISLLIAGVLASVIVGRVVLFSGDVPLPGGMGIYSVGLAIGLAIAVQVVISTTLGGLLPLVARGFRLDPAVLVSPVLASVVDITGMLIYFFTVTRLLGL
ncbi:MAG: magnesium transporter [Endozoicomonas sp.]|uniref:magnesium transporter n=1 Tax=Endozoicomonas sp. TaxID=1892382 RepID=UPI003D9B436C